MILIGEESELPKNEKKESKKLTAWCWVSCTLSSWPMSRFFLGAALASDSSREMKTASNLIAGSVIISEGSFRPKVFSFWVKLSFLGGQFQTHLKEG